MLFEGRLSVHNHGGQVGAGLCAQMVLLYVSFFHACVMLKAHALHNGNSYPSLPAQLVLAMPWPLP